MTSQKSEAGCEHECGHRCGARCEHQCGPSCCKRGLPNSDFLQRALDRWTAVVSNSVDTWTEIFCRMQSGQYGFGDAVRDGTSLVNLQVENLVELLSLPLAAGGEVTPTVLFVRDAVTEYAEKKSVLIRASLDSSSAPAATPLAPRGGGTPRSGFLRVERSGRFLSIELVRITNPSHPAESLPPGHYVASVYAVERGNPVSLAVVHVVKLDQP